MGPRVSVIIPAFNLAQYLPTAIESALVQDLPAGQVEVIVVDDGSTDGTPQVLERFAERVRVIRQRNRGLVGAVDCGLAEVRGEFVALLDADDEWPPDRLRRHLAALDANRAVGLVHGDMEVVDDSGQTIHPSFFTQQGIVPTDGRVLGRLISNNFISGGASTFRASLLPGIHPIAQDAAYPDWWIAACVAAVAEIAGVDGIANRYRYHGANMGLGATAERQIKIHRLELPWRRWMMWHLVDDDSVTVADVGSVFENWRNSMRIACLDEPAGARALLEESSVANRRPVLIARDSAPHAPACKALLRALSRDPFDGALEIDLDVSLHRDASLPLPPPSPPLIGLETRSRLTIGWLDELLGEPALLHGFARQALHDSDGTLAILAARGADLSPLAALVESDERLLDERCDITLINEPLTTPARLLLTARADARLSLSDAPEPYGSLPLHETALPAARAAA